MYLIGHLVITSSKLLYNYIYRFLDTNELPADPCFVYLFSVLNDLENGKISDILKHLQHAVKSIAPSGISLQNSCVRRVTTVMHEPTGSSDNPVRFTAGLTVTIPVHATLENIQNADSIRLKVFEKYMHVRNGSNSYSSYTNITWVGAVYALYLNHEADYKNCSNPCYMSIIWVAIEFISYNLIFCYNM